MSRQGLLKRYDTFIFDWDGTLTTVKVIMKLNEMINPRWHYRKKRSVGLIDKYSVSMPSKLDKLNYKEVRRHIKAKGIENDFLAPLADISLYLMRPKLHNNSREVLAKLKNRGASVALFTNGAAYRILREIEYLGLEGYFSAIESAQALNALKPNPLGIEVIVRSLKSKRKRTIYIGDMVSDVEAAKYAGIGSCAIASGFDSFERLEGASPDYIFGSMEAFEKAL
jgi:phosphoglycolate phosphatase-like HAD superfamily hydrolase